MGDVAFICGGPGFGHPYMCQRGCPWCQQENARYERDRIEVGYPVAEAWSWQENCRPDMRTVFSYRGFRDTVPKVNDTEESET